MKKVYIQVCVNLQNIQEIALFSGKIYTAAKNLHDRQARRSRQISSLLSIHFLAMMLKRSWSSRIWLPTNEVQEFRFIDPGC